MRISGAKGKQELVSSAKSKFSAEIIKASVKITLHDSALVSATQSGEAYAYRFETGPSRDELNTVNTTAIAEEDGTDGWKPVAFDVPRTFFKNGTYYQIFSVHAVKVRGLPATDGDDDVIFRTPNSGAPILVFKIEYEPEEVE